MAIEIFPSSFGCDCGEEIHFFERTVRDLKRESKNKKVRLRGDYDHIIVFHRGKASEIICPKNGRCQITESE